MAESEGKPLAVKARRGVVLATAGFSRNEDYIKNFMPKLMTGGSFGSQWQQGDGIVMGQAVGAKLVGMWIPQAATIGVPTTATMTPCEVLDVQGEVISGLYATGSTTGGWRGKWYPSSDTVVSFTVTIGRIAGLSAAALDPCKQWSKHVT